MTAITMIAPLRNLCTSTKFVALIYYIPPGLVWCNLRHRENLGRSTVRGASWQRKKGRSSAESAIENTPSPLDEERRSSSPHWRGGCRRWSVRWRYTCKSPPVHRSVFDKEGSGRRCSSSPPWFVRLMLEVTHSRLGSWLTSWLIAILGYCSH